MYINITTSILDVVINFIAQTQQQKRYLKKLKLIREKAVLLLRAISSRQYLRQGKN